MNKLITLSIIIAIDVAFYFMVYALIVAIQD